MWKYSNKTALDDSARKLFVMFNVNMNVRTVDWTLLLTVYSVDIYVVIHADTH